MLTPRAKKEVYLNGNFPLSASVNVAVKDEISAKVFNVLTIFFNALKISFTSVKDNADIILELDETLSDKIEHYKISISKEGITLSFADFLGGRNAAASLYQLIRVMDGNYFAVAAEIDDWADNRLRGILLDPARRFLPVNELKETFIRMSLDKMNIAHLHLMDSVAYVLQSHKYPEVNDEAFGFYKTEEMRDIVAFGQSLGIECIPEIEIPAHAKHLTGLFPFLKCETEIVQPSTWTMCVGSEKFYEFFTDIINEVADVFPYEILHIGTDELAMFDHDEPHIRAWPTWFDCKHCKKIAKEQGIYLTPAEEVVASEADGTFRERGVEGVTELFYYAVKRIHGIVKKAGKRMMMWNDNIDISKPCDLPRDILIHFWRIAMPYRGPIMGCSMNAFLKAGFEVINSHYPQTYVEADFYYPEVPLNAWAPGVYPPSDLEYKDQILGGWPCAWSNYEHYAYTLPSTLAFYADRLWDEAISYYGDDFCKSITRLILGPSIPDDFNVFAALGGYFIPRSNPKIKKEDRLYGRVDKVKISAEDVAQTESTLRSLANNETLEGRTAYIYADCVRWVYEQMTRNL